MEKATNRLITDIIGLILLLLITVLGYIVYSAPGILLGGGLAITVWVTADIVLFRKG